MGDYKQMDDAPAGPLPPPFALSKLDSDTWPTFFFVFRLGCMGHLLSTTSIQFGFCPFHES